MEPLTAEDIADAIAWVATRPARVNIDQMLIMPRDQAAAQQIHRV
jgi:NADP-dependent 3-hydroxy acid dehydrogenase YdfG